MKPNNSDQGDKGSAGKDNRNVKRFARAPRVEPSAKAVETAPDQATRDEVARMRGRKSDAEISVDKLIAKGRGLLDRVALRMREAVDRLRARYGKQR